MAFKTMLETFANEIAEKFALSVRFNPEDQLKGPVERLLRGAASLLGLNLTVVTEAQVQEVAGRPDMGLAIDSLLVGYVELKAPGKGADTGKLRGSDKAQWEKFQNLPNLLYTDGNEWALYHTGERVGKRLRLSGDVTTDGASAISDADAGALLELLRAFLAWEPLAPATPRALAEMLAPITRLLRADVLGALADPASNLSQLASDWRQYLFPEADDAQFADAYAQTLTYALLLARFSSAESLTIARAVRTLRPGHRLLADTLKILGDEAAREQIEVPLRLLERVIDAVEVETLKKDEQDDLWLYFYEDFLAAYDPKMRKDRGVYYTPVPVVQAQIRLVSELLQERFDAEFSFVDNKVITLDPASGTGTYLLTAVQHALEEVGRRRGEGMRASAATNAARNIHAFEILVGPYAVAHLRLTQQILAEGGQLPEDGVHVYLSDTLDSPCAPPPNYLPLFARPLGEEYKRAQKVKAKTSVLVCIGNPPYDRQQLKEEEEGTWKRKGGWVRFGDEKERKRSTGILKDFLDPLADAGLEVHAKNLYNDYVYFWRWALWKVFESKPGESEGQPGGIVSFITASSYLRGPGFAGMRQFMRQMLDELWIIDLEGDSLGARKSENVFAIRTPVAIAVGVRYGEPRPERPARVRYTRLVGTQEAKFEQLRAIERFDDLAWRDCLAGWMEPFLPTSDAPYWSWPLLTDIFPWQENGVQFKRTWPIGESEALLRERWQTMLAAPPAKRGPLLKESGARTIHKRLAALEDSSRSLPALAELHAGDPPPAPIRYAYRSFDRQWALLDSRLCDRPRPELLRAHSERQIYITSLLTSILGEGPAAVATALIPDLDHFRGSFGAKHIIPLWQDAGATVANVTGGVLATLSAAYGRAVTAEELFAYSYALLATPRYIELFWDELTIPGPRLPLTKSAALFAEGAALGSRLLWLHSYGERFVPAGERPGRLPTGGARCRVATPQHPEGYPDDFSYDEATQELSVGEGRFEQVRPEVWNFSVSGLEVVKSWLGYRMHHPKGKKSSPLDDLRPERWAFDGELLDLLWLLDATVDLLPQVGALLEQVLAGDTFQASDFPTPTPAERAPTLLRGRSLFDL